MTEVNIHEAKTHLSRLLERVAQGEEIIIAKAGRPVAKLIKIQPRARRVLGSATGAIRFRRGWDAPLTDRELAELIGH